MFLTDVRGGVKSMIKAKLLVVIIIPNIVYIHTYIHNEIMTYNNFNSGLILWNHFQFLNFFIEFQTLCILCISLNSKYKFYLSTLQDYMTFRAWIIVYSIVL